MIINGNAETVILIFRVIRPITKSKSIRVLKQVNPVKLSILLTLFWKMVYNMITCPKNGTIIKGCKMVLKSFFAFKNISASA